MFFVNIYLARSENNNSRASTRAHFCRSIRFQIERCYLGHYFHCVKKLRNVKFEYDSDNNKAGGTQRRSIAHRPGAKWLLDIGNCQSGERKYNKV